MQFVSNHKKGLILLAVLGLSCAKTFPGSDLSTWSLLNSTGLSSTVASTTPGITLQGSTSIFTSESGTSNSFQVVLNTQPTASVTINITSSNTGEGTVSPASVGFTTANWNVPQTVTVTGVRGPLALADGNQVYSIITSPATSSDPNYSGYNPPDLSAVNFDIDYVAGTVGVSVAPTLALTTSENGTTAQFAVVLTSAPTGNVVVDLASSTPTEGTVAPLSLTFTTLNWNTPQVATVTGVNDFIVDGNIGFTVQATVNAASTVDTSYKALANPVATVNLTNYDNDTAGATIAPLSGLSANETGTTATFTAVLNSQPQAGKQVQIDFTSTNTAKGTVSPASFVFTPANWNTPTTVTVTGVDNTIADGNVSYVINSTINGVGTTDPNYALLGPFPSVSVTTVDNETVGITVSAISGNTSEAGATATFTAVLNSDPGVGGNVTVPLMSSNTTEGIVSPASLLFTGGACPGTGNWCTPQTVTVTGVDDFIQDGNIAYSIITQPATSANPLYNGFNATDVAVTNTDNDLAGLSVNNPGGLSISPQTTRRLDFTLNTQPTANVTVPLDLTAYNPRIRMSLDGGTTWVSSANLSFTPTNWYVARSVLVQTQLSGPGTGYPAFTFFINALVSADTNYTFNPADIAGTSVDPKYLFITTATHDAKFDTNSDGNGIPEADAFCMADPLHGTAVFKAFLASATRIPSTTPNTGAGQTNWVLKPNTPYYRLDNVLVFQSNANSLYDFGIVGVSGTSLSAPISTVSTQQFWTGLYFWTATPQYYMDWIPDTTVFTITHGEYTCANWSSNASGAANTTDIGDASYTNGYVFSAVWPKCNTLHSLLCIEQ